MCGKALYVKNHALSCRFLVHISKCVRSALDDLLLYCLIELHEKSTVARHADNKVFVAAGMLLCVEQDLSVHNIKLNMLAPLVAEIGSDKCSELLRVLVGF